MWELIVELVFLSPEYRSWRAAEPPVEAWTFDSASNSWRPNARLLAWAREYPGDLEGRRLEIAEPDAATCNRDRLRVIAAGRPPGFDADWIATNVVCRQR